MTEPPGPNSQLTRDLDTVNRLADAARAAILPHFRGADLASENKSASGFDPVTIADRAAELAMREILRRAAPEDGVLGEEFDDEAGRSGRTWVLDPIDGTRAFMSGMPLWGVLIGLYDAAADPARPILGAADQPYLAERYIGLDVDGRPASARLVSPQGERALRVRACADLAEATLYATDPNMFAATIEQEAFARVESRVRLRRYGGDCYAYAMLASGHIDVVVECGLKPFDIQALVPLIVAAGGVVSDWSGGPAHWGGQILAAGDRRAHAQALELLAPAARATPPPVLFA